MATRAEERERLRRYRLEREEAEERVRARRQRLLQLGGGVVFLAICVIAVLVVVSEGQGGGDTNLEGVADVNASLESIPQRGTLLGQRRAKATVVEFGDLQCPVCKAYSTSVVAELIDGPMREGRARLEFRSWTIVGPDSRDAAAAAYAAGEQNRYWNFIELYYRNQGTENSGYVTDDFLLAIARSAGVSDMAKWEKDRNTTRWSTVLGKTDSQAQSYGFTGTPSFVVIGPNGTRAVGTPHSAAEIESAIAQTS